MLRLRSKIQIERRYSRAWTKAQFEEKFSFLLKQSFSSQSQEGAEGNLQI